jgi:hypothetical protein
VQEHGRAIFDGVLVLNTIPAGARTSSLASFALRALRGKGRRSSPSSSSRSNAYSIAFVAPVPPVERIENGNPVRSGVRSAQGHAAVSSKS